MYEIRKRTPATVLGKPEPLMTVDYSRHGRVASLKPRIGFRVAPPEHERRPGTVQLRAVMPNGLADGHSIDFGWAQRAPAFTAGICP